QTIFTQSQTKEDFFDALTKDNLEFYARGNTLGVKDLSTNRKHRLKTLGLLDAFEALSSRFESDDCANQKRQRYNHTSDSLKDQTQTSAKSSQPGSNQDGTLNTEKTKNENTRTQRQQEMENLREKKPSSNENKQGKKQ
ncbi:MAG: hypothetical protein OQK69_02065, partial [Gammaproteobacteria bacterium]|nr:hypothetical protein [Gammaproteobacteria bacterium]